MTTKILSNAKVQAILTGVKDSVSRFNGTTLEKIAEPQADKLEQLRFSLVITVDASKDTPVVTAEISYGGRRYKELL